MKKYNLKNLFTNIIAIAGMLNLAIPPSVFARELGSGVPAEDRASSLVERRGFEASAVKSRYSESVSERKPDQVTESAKKPENRRILPAQKRPNPAYALRMKDTELLERRRRYASLEVNGMVGNQSVKVLQIDGVLLVFLAALVLQLPCCCEAPGISFQGETMIIDLGNVVYIVDKNGNILQKLEADKEVEKERKSIKTSVSKTSDAAVKSPFSKASPKSGSNGGFNSKGSFLSALKEKLQSTSDKDCSVALPMGLDQSALLCDFKSLAGLFSIGIGGQENFSQSYLSNVARPQLAKNSERPERVGEHLRPERLREHLRTQSPRVGQSISRRNIEQNMNLIRASNKQFEQEVRLNDRRS